MTTGRLMLKTVARGRLHEWGIAERLQQIWQATLLRRQGSRCPVLHRLEPRGWVTARSAASEHQRRAQSDTLTSTGRTRLRIETDVRRALTVAIGRVLGRA